MAPSDDISDNHGGVNQAVIPPSIYYHRHPYREIETRGNFLIILSLVKIETRDKILHFLSVGVRALKENINDNISTG